MQLALLWYVLLNLLIFGLVLVFVRASRLRARPNERQDLEENALIRADWELVRRERCVPSGCPRVIGQPPRPRRDVTCEVCAATFLELRLQQVLEAPPAAEAPQREACRGAEAMPARANAARTAPLEERRERDTPAREQGGRGHRPSRGSSAGRRARGACLRFGLGIACVAVGAGVAAFGGVFWWIASGYLIVLVGLGLMASGAASGAL